jgi:hypothetical protein
MWASRYLALQVQDQGYIAPGAQLIAYYTWATSRRPSSEHCIVNIDSKRLLRESNKVIAEHNSSPQLPDLRVGFPGDW